MKNVYIPSQAEPFKLSRSKIELFIECSYCFYLDRRLGIARPSGPSFTLNSAVDALLKKECDGYRIKQHPHPIAQAYNLMAVPYMSTPPELLDNWRNNKKGIFFFHQATNFHVYGAIDDVWINQEGELIIIDYKATSKAGEIVLDQEYHNAYRRQLDIYAWLFKMNLYKVQEKAYWIYCNGIKNVETFDNQLTFKTVLIEHLTDTSWIENILLQAYGCLNQKKPPNRTKNCPFCTYLDSIDLIA